MPKTSKRRSPKPTAARATTAKPPQPAITDPEKKNDAGSKQARVIEMLQSPTGVTIAAMKNGHIALAPSWQMNCSTCPCPKTLFN